jgi:hypothetical protein
MLQKIQETADFLKSKISGSPKTGLFWVPDWVIW